ncbi:MAG: hypothetical protein RML36_03685 [Anaerolineae bacterium]|nr:hypothetical protein [Anaerolineae bacterium]MDW8098571.1 hypothetical protein [Anaerolineae bacterium]
MSTTIVDQRERACRALLRDKIHLDLESRTRLPILPSKSPLGRSAWAPALKLADRLQIFPSELLDWWAVQPTGHVVIGSGVSTYQPGPAQIGRRVLVNVVRIALLDLIHNEAAIFSALARLFDHLLGCNGEPAGLWLSEGGGCTPEWQAVGRRIQASYALGYAPSIVISPRDYFAWGIAIYCTDRRQLNLADPVLERLLRATVMNSSFWQKIAPQGT